MKRRFVKWLTSTRFVRGGLNLDLRYKNAFSSAIRCPGVGMLLCAPSNGNTGRIYDAVSAWMARSKHELDRDTQKPQRVYRVHLEEEYLLKDYDHFGNASGKKLDEAQAASFMEAASRNPADAAWYERQEEADRRKAMNDATSSNNLYTDIGQGLTGAVGRYSRFKDVLAGARLRGGRRYLDSRLRIEVSSTGAG